MSRICDEVRRGPRHGDNATALLNTAVASVSLPALLLRSVWSWQAARARARARCVRVDRVHTWTYT